MTCLESFARTAPEAHGPSWYAVHAANKSDAHVRYWLGPDQADFRTYYPLVREMRPVPRKRQSQKQRRSPFRAVEPILVPFFPRYWFVYFDPCNSAWRKAFEIAGVGGMLCHHGLPAPISETEILKLRAREVNGALPGEMRVGALFKIGEIVRIGEYPFAGFNGPIQEFRSDVKGAVDKTEGIAIAALDPNMRIIVLASLFGRATPVELEISQIEKL